MNLCYIFQMHQQKTSSNKHFKQHLLHGLKYGKCYLYMQLGFFMKTFKISMGQSRASPQNETFAWQIIAWNIVSFS
jgi:hypothetical protein